MRPRDLSTEEKQRLRALLALRLEEKKEILFAYVYGSFVQGPFRDIDIAVFLADGGTGSSDPLRYELALEQELEEVTGCLSMYGCSPRRRFRSHSRSSVPGRFWYPAMRRRAASLSAGFSPSITISPITGSATGGKPLVSYDEEKVTALSSELMQAS